MARVFSVVRTSTDGTSCIRQVGSSANPPGSSPTLEENFVCFPLLQIATVGHTTSWMNSIWSVVTSKTCSVCVHMQPEERSTALRNSRSRPSAPVSLIHPCTIRLLMITQRWICGASSLGRSRTRRHEAAATIECLVYVCHSGHPNRGEGSHAGAWRRHDPLKIHA